MEQKLNIAEILKNKPRGTKLYSTVHGKCTFEAITDEIFKINFCTSKFGLTQSGECTLIKFGNMYDGGECIIFPSNEMRDWSKFAWQKGDVLVGENNAHIIFEKFTDATYTTFIGRHYFNGNYIQERYTCVTQHFHTEEGNAAQTYISNVEKEIGGKLNLKTLEIEKSKFKNGDIVISDTGVIVLVRRTDLTYIYYHAYMSSSELYINPVEGEFFSRISRIKRFATDSEKQQLFDALAKKGKRWDVEKKQIVDLKPKCTLKPFDRVITRNDDDDIWTANIFSHIDQYGKYVTIGCVGGYPYCIPYNEETAKLIGTTKEWKE